jgi:lysyl-tRNA synthetase, class II
LKTRALAINEWASRRLRGDVAPAVASFAILTSLLLGLINVAFAAGGRFSVLESGAERLHVVTWQGSAALPALLGIFLLMLTYQLWLRKRAALILFSVFIVAQAVVEVLRGMNHQEGAFVVLVGMVFLASMAEFPARPNPGSLRRLKLTVPLATLGFFGVGVLGLYLMRASLGLTGDSLYALAYRSAKVATGDSGLIFHGWENIYRYSLTLLALALITYLAVLLFRPYRETAVDDPALRRRAYDLVKSYGSDSLAYFTLRNDKMLFHFNDEMFIAYKTIGNMAIISGDPVGPVELIPQAMEAFRQYCLQRGWRVGAIGASGELEPFYQDAGLKCFHVGDESIINLDRFTLDGRNVRKLRQSVNKLERMGTTIEFMFNAGIPSHMRHELEQISVDWRGGKDEVGYSMGLGRLMSAEDPDCLLSMAYDPDMNPIGFIYWVPMYPNLGYSLDIHRTRLDAPSALSEFIIAKTARFLQQKGCRYLSLHFLCLAQHYREDREQPGSPFWRNVARAISGFFPVVTVYRFDRKFFPTWKKRLLLHQGALDLLLVGLAAISAEAALQVTRPSDREK